MRTDEELVTELHQRMKTRRQEKARHRFIVMSTSAFAACLVLVLLAAVGISRRPIEAASGLSGSLTASIFADHAALGYVIIALVAFCLGALVTVLCFRLKRSMDKEERDDDREP